MKLQLALVQHPMYFLIREDSQCAERTPPWGEPTIERYIERVGQNLAALREYPDLKIGYEWSGLELELLAQDNPAVFSEMCALAREGRLAFYNGTYSQPHLQILSSEANYRQFEFGMRVYRELCEGHPVRVYAHQEASVHDQLPQLLRAFGIEYGTVPSFSSTLAWLDGGELLIQGGPPPRFVNGREFAAWRGLDGTEIPLYLNQHLSGELEDWIARQEIGGRPGMPSILTAIPDLIKIDEAWMARHHDVQLVLLDEALARRAREQPPHAKVRFYSNWSYIEGIRAEELSRGNVRAEASALRAEALNALAFALLGRPAESGDGIWKNILATQHHDVYCFCAPGLRDKCIGWLREAEQEASRMARDAAQAITDRVACAESDSQPMVVFNAVPHTWRGVVTIDLPLEDPEVLDGQGRIVPAESAPDADGVRHVRFLTDLPGLGYNTYWIRGGGGADEERALDGPLSFENDHYRATVLPDGTFLSLALPSEEELLDSREIRSNHLAATDSTGLSPRHDGMASRTNWQPSRRGPELRWEPTASARVRRSTLGVTLYAPGRLGPRVNSDLTLRFYHRLPRIDLSWHFTFNAASIGTFYDDDSKLRVHWPLAFDSAIHHDIAFGVVQTRAGVPFFPAGWTDMSDGRKGLAYFHAGTPKHWLTGRTLVNLFAWGEETNAIGSRMWRYNWPKSFDQRLRGSHTIQCALYPHPGDWRVADVIGVARSWGASPIACLADSHRGPLPQTTEGLRLSDPAIVATAVKVVGSDIVCRAFSVGETTTTSGVETQGLRFARWRSLVGDGIQGLNSFQIGELVLEPEWQTRRHDEQSA